MMPPSFTKKKRRGNYLAINSFQYLYRESKEKKAESVGQCERVNNCVLPHKILRGQSPGVTATVLREKQLKTVQDWRLRDNVVLSVFAGTPLGCRNELHTFATKVHQIETAGHVPTRTGAKRGCEKCLPRRRPRRVDGFTEDDSSYFCTHRRT